MTTRVAIVGATGKLGGIIRDVVAAEPGFEVHSELDSRSAMSELDGADLVVDATTPAVSIDIVKAAAERGSNAAPARTELLSPASRCPHTSAHTGTTTIKSTSTAREVHRHLIRWF